MDAGVGVGGQSNLPTDGHPGVPTDGHFVTDSGRGGRVARPEPPGRWHTLRSTAGSRSTYGSQRIAGSVRGLRVIAHVWNTTGGCSVARRSSASPRIQTRARDGSEQRLWIARRHRPARFVRAWSNSLGAWSLLLSACACRSAIRLVLGSAFPLRRPLWNSHRRTQTQ